MNDKLRSRRFGPIDRLFSIYELCEGEEIILQISREDDGIRYLLSFYPAIDGRTYALGEIEARVAQAKKRLEDEEPI